MTDSDCPFCNINPQRNPILWEGREIVVILSNPRLMQGHTLVVPKDHLSSLAGMNPAVLTELFGTAVRFQQKLKQLMGPGTGCDLSQHDRPFMPTTRLTVPLHVHIHLRPRTWQDNFYERVSRHETDVFATPDAEELRRIANLLRE